MAHCKVEDSADFVIVTHGSQHNGETLIKRQILISSDGYHYSFRRDRPRPGKRILINKECLIPCFVFVSATK